MKTRVHLFRSSGIEVPKPRGRYPCSYRWTTGWAEKTVNGYSAPLTLRHWQAIARRDGFSLILHRTEAAAAAALHD